MSDDEQERYATTDTSPVTAAEIVPIVAVPIEAAQSPIAPQVPPAVAGFGRVFGLDPRAAILTVLVDLLLFGGDILSFGFLVVFGMFVAAALGWIVYRIQRFTYGDDHNAALTKAAIVALLTAIPVPLTPLIAVPGGIIGTLSLLKRARR
jgi:hypothetical protein